MARVNKTLTFPLGGVVRRDNYREQSRPYSAPWAVNVRGVDVLESRNRGGSRPGLAEVTGITAEANGVFQWPNGTNIEWSEGVNIEFLYPETLMTIGDVTVVDRTSLITAVADVGTIPSSYTISCIYRDRLILAKDELWYASRMGNHRDWNYGADMDDSARAVFGSVELAGKKTVNDITAIIPFRDKALIIATCNSLHILEGDPATGSLRILDENIGIIGPYAWAWNGDILAFLSNDGVYIASVGQQPVRFSEGRIPGQLKNVSNSNTITMAYDAGARGFHLFITPTPSGTGQHYFLDFDNKAIWPVVFGAAGHQPVAVAIIKSTNIERIMVKGRDLTWREFLASSADDAGTTIQSHVLIGPVRLTSNDVVDAMLVELHGIMGASSGTVTWRLVMADSAEVAVDNAVADMTLVLAGSAATHVAASGTFAAGRNYVAHPRTRGSWAVVWLSATSKWAYEAVALVAQQLGRER